ncbi:MAG: PilT/PilU family type 4a pilus ATPase [Polyangiales bacterium]
MAQIDRYIQHMLRIDARALVLTSNGPVLARLASGAEKSSTQTVEHALLVAAVQEAAPQQNLNEIRSSKPTRFAWPVESPTVFIDVVPTPGAWRVTITPWEPPRPSDSPPAVSRVSSLPGERATDIGTRATAAPAPPVTHVPSPPLFAQPAAPQPSFPQPSFPQPSYGSSFDEGHRASLPGPAPAAPAQPVAIVSAPEPKGDTTAIDRLLRFMSNKGASDLHISTARVPMMRLHGEVKVLAPELPVLTAEAMRAMLGSIMPPHCRQQYADRNDTDFAYEIAGLARFRVNAFVDRKGPCGVFRRIPSDIISAETLGLSKSMLELCDLPKGLVLVTGPTGSGKSTTLAAMIDKINNTRRDHIITVEDPIEFVHKNKKCLVNQREVRVHTDTFKDALRAALREDPDVVLVGEMRDLETVAMAIETAETGHLVFGTLHTRTAPSTVDRIIDQFPAERQEQIRMMLSDSLRGVISQTLCKKIGGGRAAAQEVLIVTPAVSNMIREGKTHQLYGVMQTGRQYGMQTLNDALCDLVKAGKIDSREAWFRAVQKGEMRATMQSVGIPLPPGVEAR